jgi:D-sedoheptulose 7-phosphate isomerase
VSAAAGAIVDALRAGHLVLAYGNGGSAAEAEHFVAELVGRFVADRRAFRAVALASNASLLTAVSNDYGFAHVFARQIEALGGPGDVAVGISTSGESPSVVHGLETARLRGLTTVALTGRDGGAAGRVAAIHVNVPEPVVARVQEVHATVLHAMCELVDEELGKG